MLWPKPKAGVRWWPPADDAGYGMQPSMSSPERRAGICWPCPSGFTSSSAALCDTSTLPQTQLVASTLPTGRLRVARIPTSNRMRSGSASRRLLSVSEEQTCSMYPHVHLTQHGCTRCPTHETCIDGKRLLSRHSVEFGNASISQRVERKGHCPRHQAEDA